MRKAAGVLYAVGGFAFWGSMSWLAYHKLSTYWVIGGMFILAPILIITVHTAVMIAVPEQPNRSAGV